MPISRADYEIAPADEVEAVEREDTAPKAVQQACVKAAPQAPVNTTSAAIPEAVNPAKEVPRRAIRPIPAAPELPGDPAPPQSEAAQSAPERAEENQPDAGGPEAEPATDTPAEQPPSLSQPAIPPDAQPAAEQNETDDLPEWAGGRGDFKNTVDAARGRINRQSQNPEELQAVLEQAVTLLEGLAGHPAIVDYGALKQRLDNIEQILNSSANVR